jgi:predicted transglutaminase-like cysteine proteinase
VGIFFAAFGGSAQLAASEQSPTSLPASTNSLEIQGEAQPTKAWTEFCARAPTECTVNLSEPPAVVLTHAAWVMVTSVNVRVNRSIQGMTDMEHWGTEDRWDYPNDGKGDCEDFQLLKRRILVRNGVPRRSMRMTVVIDELGQGHAVLVLRTDRGDLVLDNKHDAVLPWDRTGYVFLKRESSDRTQWVSFGDKGARFTTAAPD